MAWTRVPISTQLFWHFFFRKLGLILLQFGRTYSPSVVNVRTWGNHIWLMNRILTHSYLWHVKDTTPKETLENSNKLRKKLIEQSYRTIMMRSSTFFIVAMFPIASWISFMRRWGAPSVNLLWQSTQRNRSTFNPDFKTLCCHIIDKFYY